MFAVTEYKYSTKSFAEIHEICHYKISISDAQNIIPSGFGHRPASVPCSAVPPAMKATAAGGGVRGAADRRPLPFPGGVGSSQRHSGLPCDHVQ